MGWSVLDAKFYAAPGSWTAPTPKSHLVETINPEELNVHPENFSATPEETQSGFEEWEGEIAPAFYWESDQDFEPATWVLPAEFMSRRGRFLENETHDNFRETQNPEELLAFPDEFDLEVEFIQTGYRNWAVQSVTDPKAWLVDMEWAPASWTLPEPKEHLKETQNPEEFAVHPESAHVIPEDAQDNKNRWVIEKVTQTSWTDSIQAFYFYWVEEIFTPLFYWTVESEVNC